MYKGADDAELEASTKMFGHLANPNGANNALSQVLYGLALRYVLPRPDSTMANLADTVGAARKTQHVR